MKSFVAILPKALTLEVALGMVVFTIPLFLSGPQLLVGTIVSALLIIIAVKTSPKYWLPLAMLPSLGAFMHGVLFGPLTFFLLYFLPVIWLGNYIFMRVAVNKIELPLAVKILVASSFKAALLFLLARIYYGLGIVPAVFIVAMGINQWFTALAGGIIGSLALANGGARRE
ncbi:hypothetical protein A2160_03410 [Candidatus Beckwithbacteria bacterium RBG_13_42_9]|uniref:Heptaprenyl diphosphate synthase n=1 Tax=Candidatus Beckwithbacteria bacterium RBG_13_42_9 TaxID=1797457 RepID=A0A1F5E8G9_9BACT|nr:MAG: hypothetical protein A2160_03410 [Candidatus Beckwithbacteria bacterium RBG_13_42_9]